VTDSEVSGYDVIGDIHGCADELEGLLGVLGYRRDGGAGPYRHGSRRAIFVGDLIDRGPQQLGVLQTVKEMVDSGSARMVLGNHEFNALADATEWPVASGKFLRPHDDPSDPKSAKNERQHEEFLDQVRGTQRTHYPTVRPPRVSLDDDQLRSCLWQRMRTVLARIRPEMR